MMVVLILVIVSDSPSSEATKQKEKELQNKIQDLEEQLETSRREEEKEPEVNRLLQLVDQAKSDREQLVMKCDEMELKLREYETRQELLEDVTKELKEHIEKIEEKKNSLEDELNGKAENELELLRRVSELQDELANTLERLKEQEETKGGLDAKQQDEKDLERERDALQKQLYDSFLQISSLKVRRSIPVSENFEDLRKRRL